MRWVVADDSPILRQKHTQFLRKLGFDVVGQACNGQEAVDLCAELRPEAILLDLNMMAADGDSIVGGADAMRAVLRGDYVQYVFVLTSTTARATLEPLKALGGVIINKPVCDAKALGVYIDRAVV